MRKLQKAEIVQAIQEKMARSQIAILTDFTGLKVEDMTRLRRQIQEAAGELKVVKNTLLVRAAAGDSPMSPLGSQFTGPNALTLGYHDPVALTKVLIKFAQERPQLQIKSGVLGGRLLSLKDLEALSKMPAREVLLAQFLGLLQGVPTALVTVLSGVIRNLLNVLVALKDQKTGSEPATAALEAKDEAAAPAPEAGGEADTPAPEAGGEPEAPAAQGNAGPEARSGTESGGED